MKPKNIICLWFEGGAEEAAHFYAATFPDSSVGVVATVTNESSETPLARVACCLNA